MRLPPFDTEQLDALMEQAGIDVVLATSKHNVRYLLGDYSSFFAHFDSIGMDRFLPAVGYPFSGSDRAFYIASEIDRWQQELAQPWVPTGILTCQSSRETARMAAELIDKLGLGRSTIAVEHSFFPAGAFGEFRRALPHSTIVEAFPILDELRTVKRPDELKLLREASEGIVSSIVATVQSARPGITTRSLAERLRLEETASGLEFEYCLAATGPSFNRSPSQMTWQEGCVLSLDSGGTKTGYIGDLCRMAVIGEPTPLMKELMAELKAIQESARKAIRPGALGGEVYERALAELAKTDHRHHASFLAHGMGLTSHEAPRLTDIGPIRYEATHCERPLEVGMVLSIETDLTVPGVGFIKLEDTVAVAENGWEAFGDDARDWIVVEV